MPTPDDDDSACPPAIAAALDVLDHNKTLLLAAAVKLDAHIRFGVNTGAPHRGRKPSEHVAQAIIDLTDLIEGIEFTKLRDAVTLLAEYERTI